MAFARIYHPATTLTKMKICKTDSDDPHAAAVLDCIQGNGLPYLIIIVTLVLCSLLLATIALIIVIVVIRQKRKSRSDSLQDEAISYDAMNKPETRAMEVQPDLRSLEPRNDPRAFMPFAPIPTRRYTSLPFESQSRLIPVPEEEGSADERLTSPEDIFSFPIYALEAEDGQVVEFTPSAEILDDETDTEAQGTPIN